MHCPCKPERCRQEMVLWAERWAGRGYQGKASSAPLQETQEHPGMKTATNLPSPWHIHPLTNMLCPGETL